VLHSETKLRISAPQIECELVALEVVAAQDGLDDLRAVFCW
jgi:hypothetical protein